MIFISFSTMSSEGSLFLFIILLTESDKFKSTLFAEYIEIIQIHFPTFSAVHEFPISIAFLVNLDCMTE